MSITSQDILNDRAARKAAGDTGCITGKPTPEINLFGFRDVQIWYMDANGRMNGDPGFDRMNPLCFCFDCRGAFDKDGIIDAELVNNGHEGARHVYHNLLGQPAQVAVPLVLGLTVDTDVPHFRSSSDRVPDLQPIVTVDTTQPSYTSFSQVPTSFPAPRARDIMNETSDERLRNDLSQLRSSLQANLLVTSDSRRRLAFMNAQEAAVFAAQVDAEESDLWAKVEAIDLLLR